jgi:hypothetical protein
MRDELAGLIRARCGLDEATALQVADLAIEFVKGKLPPAVAPMLDGDMSGLGGMAGGLGGLFGQRPTQ